MIINIVIRTDASIEIGTGHVMRCITLAESLKRKGANVSFICRKLAGNLIHYIKGKGFSVIVLPSPSNSNFNRDPKINHSHWLQVSWKTDVAQTKHVLSKQQTVDWLILDHYAIDAKWEEEILPFVKKLMVIDDLADRFHACDLLLDQNLYKNTENRYDQLVSEKSLRLLGPKYVLLRQEFVDLRKMVKERDGTISRILIFFGGTDITNETAKAINAIKLLTSNDIRVDVVVGGTNQNKQQIEQMCKPLPNIVFHCQIDYIASLMLKADLAIGAGGSTTWERCYLALPSLTIETAENQADILSILDERGVVFHLGKSEDVQESEIALSLERLIRKPEEVKKVSKACLSLMGEIDGDAVTQHIIGGDMDCV